MATIYDYLGEDGDQAESFRYPPERVVRAINRAQRMLMVNVSLDRDSGLWAGGRADLAVAEGATSVALPADCYRVVRVRTEDGDEVVTARWVAESARRQGIVLSERNGVWIEGANLRWETAATAAATWTVEYVRYPGDARTGLLGDQSAAGADEAILPATDSRGAVSVTDEEYTGWALGIVLGTGLGENELVSGYTGSSRTAVLAAGWGTAPVSGDRYLLMESWPEQWLEALALAATALAQGQVGLKDVLSNAAANTRRM